MNLFQNYGGKSEQGTLFIIARVTKVVYGPYLADGKTPDPDYTSPVDIGKIRFVVDNSSQMSSDFGDANKPAKPAWSSFSHFPVENEYVYVIPGPGEGKNETSGDQEYYYLPPFSLWGDINQNAFPALDEYAAFKQAELLSIQDTEIGVPNSQGDVGIEYPLGNNFVERENIRVLRKFVGDVTIEGRYGNSIRFGSSLASLRNDNNWAASSEDGDPIIIIRNGQGNPPTQNPWDPVVEDPNLDKSSIYLTAGQQIIIDDIQRNFSLESFGVRIQPVTSRVKTIPTTPPTNQTLSPETVDNVNTTNNITE